MWAARFIAGAHVKKYQQCLLEDFSEKEIVKRKLLAEPKIEGESEAETKQTVQEDIKAGISAEEIDMVVQAYADLLFACSEEISFGIVFNSKSVIFPEGDAYLAWTRLKRKYEPCTNAQKIMLQREFHQSCLMRTNKSPDDRIEEMEIIRARLEPLGVIVSDDDLILQILEGLPKEYNMIVTLLNARYKISDLDVSTLREELMIYYKQLSRYKKICNKRNDEIDLTYDSNEETALIAAFKGRCRDCGEYGYKKIYYPKEKSDTARFNGTCFFCKKKGHMRKGLSCMEKKAKRESQCLKGYCKP